MSTEELGSRQKAAATKRKRTIRSITEAAKTLFDEKGWHDVTRDDIAAAAGVGVATIHSNLGSKQNVALAAYASVLLPIVEETEAAVILPTQSETLKRFVYGLAIAVVQHPVLAIALLPASRDFRCSGTTPAADEAIIVDFDELADILGRLLEVHWNNSRPFVGPVDEVAELYLSGLLSWVLMHPDRSGEDAAELTLSQVF